MSRSYRLYCLDGAGKIVTAEWIEASSDEDAADRARNHSTGLVREVWDRTRLVARIDVAPPGKA